MRVPFLDLARLHESIRPELDAAIDRVIRDSSFIGGAEVVAFEEEFATAHEAPAAAGCASGTDALALALRALGVGPGDEVVVPSMTFVATAEAVVHAGATPVLADVDAETLLLAESSVEQVRTERTRAVVPVHLYGHVVPFDALRRWREAGLIVVEDSAQAHLATWQGEPVGSVGHAACFSFYPGKNLGAFGDAGAVLSNDTSLVEEIRRLRDHGRSAKHTHDEIGWCSRLDGLQAAILRAKLRHLERWTERRRALAAAYAGALPAGVLVPWEEGAVHHLVVVQLDDRDTVAQTLRAEGIDTGVHYPVALSRQPALASWTRSTPHAERASGRILSMPIDPLMPPELASSVAAAVTSARS